MSRELRVLIADDEEPARVRLKSLLQRIPEVCVVGDIDDGDRVLDACRDLRPDCLLLDIRMPGLSGLDIADLVRSHVPTVRVVFVTAYDAHAVDAFDLDVDDYLTKPVRPSRLAKAIERVRGRLRPSVNEGPDRIGLPLGDLIEFVSARDIAYAVYGSGVIDVKLRERTIHLPWNLAQLEEKLEHAGDFLKVSRQAIVNLAQVRAMEPMPSGTSLLRMRDGQTIEASRSATRRLRELL